MLRVASPLVELCVASPLVELSVSYSHLYMNLT